MGKGYAGKILRVDLSTGAVRTDPTEDYAERFLGGRGLAACIYWDEVKPKIDAFEEENQLIFVTGPVCGFKGFAGSRWQICGKSPLGNQFSYCNLGGSWGVQLKFAGYDGLVIQGKAHKMIYLYIDDDTVELRDAGSLKGKGAIETREIIKGDLGRSARVVAIGPAGENRVRFATLLADADSCGSGGFGAVMGSKNLKAVVVKGNGRVEAAYPDKVGELKDLLHRLKKGNIIMDTPIAPPERMKKSICYGCIKGCWRANYTADDGQKGKYMCQSGYFYIYDARKYDKDSADVPFKANKFCDDYGIDSRVVDTMIRWLKACFDKGILTDERSGLLLSKIGSLEFVEGLVRKISLREDFGDVLAEGTLRASEYIGNGSNRLIADSMVKNGELDVYGPRLYITTGLFYAMEPRAPIQHLHEISMPLILWGLCSKGIPDIHMTSHVLRGIAKRFWGSEMAADFSTYEGKALAAAIIQDRQYSYESMILCNLTWPMIHNPGVGDHVGDPTLENQVCRAITGMDVDKSGLYRIGERVFNLQRAILIREGHGGREDDAIEEYNYTVPLKGDFANRDCIVPGQNGEKITRKGMVVDRDEFETLRNEYYTIRGWDVATGLQTKGKLKELDLGDVAERLDTQGMLA